MTKEEKKKELEAYIALHDFDRGSYLLGCKHGAGSVTIDTVSQDIIRQIAIASYDLLNDFRKSGLTSDELRYLKVEDIRRIAINNKKVKDQLT